MIPEKAKPVGGAIYCQAKTVDGGPCLERGQHIVSDGAGTVMLCADHDLARRKGADVGLASETKSAGSGGCCGWAVVKGAESAFCTEPAVWSHLDGRKFCQRCVRLLAADPAYGTDRLGRASVSLTRGIHERDKEIAALRESLERARRHRPIILTLMVVNINGGEHNASGDESQMRPQYEAVREAMLAVDGTGPKAIEVIGSQDGYHRRDASFTICMEEIRAVHLTELVV